MDKKIAVVTGAFGYTGKYITQCLLDKGYRVRTLTNSPKRPHPFGERVKPYPYNFKEPDKMAEAMRGAEVLFNTYWVRFNYGKEFSYNAAVKNTLSLFEAAKRAGIKRIVHTSITNPSEDSPLEYFRGKAQLERALRESGISYAILRPAVIFGPEDILINNIAWMLRKFPIFGIFGDGKYRLQPIFVEDFADLAVQQAEESENTIIDAIGPETFTYRELVEMIGEKIGKKRPIVSIPDWLGYLVAQLVGKIVGDVIITRDEIKGLKSDLLYTDSPPTGQTKLSEWAEQNRNTLGIRYASELKRRIDRSAPYLSSE